MRCWRDNLSGVWCRFIAYGPTDAITTPSSLASLKSRLVCCYVSANLIIKNDGLAALAHLLEDSSSQVMYSVALFCIQLWRMIKWTRWFGDYHEPASVVTGAALAHNDFSAVFGLKKGNHLK